MEFVTGIVRHAKSFGTCTDTVQVQVSNECTQLSVHFSAVSMSNANECSAFVRMTSQLDLHWFITIIRTLSSMEGSVRE
jgi:hypothetical protein